MQGVAHWYGWLLKHETSVHSIVTCSVNSYKRPSGKSKCAVLIYIIFKTREGRGG